MRELLVNGEKTFKVTVPEGAKITFSPWSPPRKGEFREQSHAAGTLRIYQGSKDNIVACYSGVTSFRDLSLGYAEQVAREEGATIWKDDEKGYVREHKQSVTREWVSPQLEAHPKKSKR